MALIDDICTEAENATIRSYKWRDRGVAPAGYIKGMAVAYARCLDQLSNGAAAAAAMAAQVGLPERDALAFYAPQFEALGETANTPVDRLRKLFALLIGLGMRESSGKHCEGRDKSAHNIDAKTAEAGLFQTSYNSVSASPILGQLVQTYTGRDDLADIFSEGVACSPASWLDHGTGPGRDYQKLTKACPAFAVEYTAVALRLIRRHWGPINNKHVEVRAASFQMLRDVEQILAASPGLTSGHTAPVSQPSPKVKALVGLATAEWEFFGRSTRSLSNEWHIVGDEKNEPFSTALGVTGAQLMTLPQREPHLSHGRLHSSPGCSRRRMWTNAISSPAKVISTISGTFICGRDICACTRQRTLYPQAT
jgi:hypothetical protein